VYRSECINFMQHPPPLWQQVLARPETVDVAVTTYEMVNSAEFGRPIQATIVSGSIALLRVLVWLPFSAWIVNQAFGI
jgi:hypothetical protein